LGIGRFNRLTKSFRYIQTGVFSEINIMNNEVPPGGGRLDGPSHQLAAPQNKILVTFGS